MNNIFSDDSILKIQNGLWEIFSIFNGNPSFNCGVRFFIGMFFSLFLLIVIKMRITYNIDKKYVVALIGSLLFLIRYLILLFFEWGYQIELYTDNFLYFLFPPVEHFFNMLALGCIAYYTLNYYEYYPGLLKKILYYIPISVSIFFIYSSYTWKKFFYNSLLFDPNSLSGYNDCIIDVQSHLIITGICLYTIWIIIYKFHKFYYPNNYILTFWGLTILEHISRIVLYYTNYKSNVLETMLHSIQLFAIPILTLHFIKAYITKYHIKKKEFEAIFKASRI